MKTHGGQTSLTKDETVLKDSILYAAEWRFPLDKDEIKDLVRTYLNRQGGRISAFNGSRQGNSWYYAFIRRHSYLSIRLSENIKRNRSHSHFKRLYRQVDSYCMGLALA